jgi:hypothetical protein
MKTYMMHSQYVEVLVFTKNRSFSSSLYSSCFQLHQTGKIYIVAIAHYLNTQPFSRIRGIGGVGKSYDILFSYEITGCRGELNV